MNGPEAPVTPQPAPGVCGRGETPALETQRRNRFVVSEKLQFVASSFLVQGLRILTTLAMARLVSPESYGLVGIVAAIAGIVACLGDLGVARSLIQLRDGDQQQLEDSALVISASMGLLQLLASISGGLYMAWSRHNPNLIAIGAITGTTYVLTCVYQFQMVCLNRDLKFGREAWQNILSAVATTVTGLAFAVSGFGIYALVLPPLAAQLISSIAVQRHHRLRWPSRCTTTSIVRLLNYGWRVTVAQYASNLQSSLVNLFICFAYPNRTADVLVGMLGRATQVRDLVGQNISTSFDRVLYPVLRASSDDSYRLSSLAVRSVSAISLLCVFSWAWMTATAHPLIRVVLGPAWVEQVPPLLRAVAPVLLFTGPTMMAIVITHALGKPLIWLAFTMATMALLAVGLFVGKKWDIIGIAVGMTTATIAGGMVLFVWVMRKIQAPFRDFFARLAPMVVAGGVSFGVMRFAAEPISTATRSWMLGSAVVQPAVSLALVSIAGLLIYLALVFAMSRQILGELLGLIRRE
jgi:PST family polysaccharide transporter